MKTILDGRSVRRLVCTLFALCTIGLVAATSEADSKGRAVCNRECYSCKNRCKTSDCEHLCVAVKRTCCKISGERPGSLLTCSCG